jgi:hypothetical protein
MLENPGSWLPDIAGEAESRGDLLLTEVGFGSGRLRVEKSVTVEIGDARRLGGKSILPMTWTPGDPGRLFPRLEADIELSALGSARTQLAISARYRPPMGAVGRLVDRTMLHLAAEATIKDFLDRVSENLEPRMSAPARG